MGFFNKFLHKTPAKDEAPPAPHQDAQDSAAVPDLPPMPPGMEQKNSSISELPELPTFQNHPELKLDDVPDHIAGLDDVRVSAQSPAMSNEGLPDLPPETQPDMPQLPPEPEEPLSIPQVPQEPEMPQMPSLDEAPSMPAPPMEPQQSQSQQEEEITQTSQPRVASMPQMPHINASQSQSQPMSSNIGSSAPLYVDMAAYKEILQDLSVAKQDLAHIHETTKDADFETRLEEKLEKFASTVSQMKDTVVLAEQKLFVKVK